MHNAGLSFKNLARQPSGPQEEEFLNAKRAARTSFEVKIGMFIVVSVRRANSGATESFIVNTL